mmetsp:Transcript_19214/g.21971  ORF Transcript_19214/g.21971 Transcript_19214/m.21971 type:complete len:385 (-) Transcript_19214:223-1377(-)
MLIYKANIKWQQNFATKSLHSPKLACNLCQIFSWRSFRALTTTSSTLKSVAKTQVSLPLDQLKKAKVPMVPFPMTPKRMVPNSIKKPPYAETGYMPIIDMIAPETILIHDEESIVRMRNAARLARKILDLACSIAEPGATTDEIDECIHESIIEHNAYPSPLNYSGFPKSACSSINEVICHGIPDTRPLNIGDVVSFDVSCYLDGVHGDNCATVIVGDRQDKAGEAGVDWRGVPYRTEWLSPEEEARICFSRKLVKATHEGLHAGIDACKPGALLSSIGNSIHSVADAYGFDTVQKYRGHGIAHIFHTAPYIKHYRNSDKLELKEGMIFTIEPMFTAGSEECQEWDDDWTVVTIDGSLAAQFEHTVLITNDGVEILTSSESEWS